MKKIFIIVLLGLAGTVWGQSARLSADTIVMGDTTVLTVKGDASVEHSEYIEVLKEETDYAQGGRRFLLTSYDPGVRYIKLGPNDSLRLVVLGVDIDPRSDEPKGLATVPATQSSEEDIEMLLDAHSSRCNALPWILAAAAVVAALVAWLWWRKAKSNKNIDTDHTSVEQKDERTAEERALARLESLKRARLWQQGKVKEHYTELTETLRVFIEETTGIRATEMTSGECLNALMHDCLSADAANTHAIKQSSIQALKDIFMTADLVKFAKGVPPAEEHERTMDKATEYVKQMSRKEAPDA